MQVMQTNHVDYWPQNKEGVDIYPKFHRTIGINNVFRISDVFIPPSTAEDPHTHGLVHFMFTDTPTALTRIAVDNAGKEHILGKRDQTPETPERPRVACVGPESYHYVQNDDPKKAFRATLIELNPAINDNNSAEEIVPFKSEGTQLELSNSPAQTNVWDITIGARKISAIFTGMNSCVLVSNLDSKLKVETQEGSIAHLPKPIGEEAVRPKVWMLYEQKMYSIINDTDTTQKIYCLQKIIKI